MQYFHFKSDWRLNRDLPTIAAWKMVQPINGQQWVLERNPYYYEVDIATATSCPYLDRIQMTLAENPEVINLRAIAGEYDDQERFIDLGKLPTLIDNAERSHYKIHLDLGFNGSDSALIFNISYRDDPEIGKWLDMTDFRRALSLGIDRDQLNEAFWLGLGTPGSVASLGDHAGEPGQGVAHALVHARCRASECAAGQDRPLEEGRRGISACAPTTASACGCRSMSARR